MANFQRVANVSDIASGQGTVVKVNGKEIALFNVDGNFFAISNVCPHSGGPLGKGRLAGNKVTCPWHGAKFDVSSGQVLAPPAPTGVDAYPTKIEAGSVWVQLS